MSRLSAFFEDAGANSGVFYPNHYLLAIFPNLEDAERAKQKLSQAGQLSKDVVAVPGDEVVRYAADHALKGGVWGALMTHVSRSIGTEAAYSDDDLVAAEKGAAFVAVHCTAENSKSAVWKILETTHPMVARYYSGGGIEHLTGEN